MAANTTIFWKASQGWASSSTLLTRRSFLVPTRKMKQEPASFSLSTSSSHCLECTEGETRDLHVARRNRDGTLTYTDLAGTDAGAGVRGPPWDQKELELQRHWFGRGEDSYCETWGTPVVIC